MSNDMTSLSQTSICQSYSYLDVSSEHEARDGPEHLTAAAAAALAEEKKNIRPRREPTPVGGGGGEREKRGRARNSLARLFQQHTGKQRFSRAPNYSNDCTDLRYILSNIAGLGTKEPHLLPPSPLGDVDFPATRFVCCSLFFVGCSKNSRA